MALVRSLSTGSSSLKANQQRFDVISNNLANANTIGFKSARVTFADQFSQVSKYGSAPDTSGGRGMGGTNPMQVGLGVKLGSIQNNMNQGAIEGTGRALDMALNGDGFFVYNMNGKELFSRAGAINRDSQGSLVDVNSGAFLKGYNVQYDANGKMIKDANNINVLNRTAQNLVIPPNLKSQPKQTQVATVTGNLDSSLATGQSRSTSITIYDNTGAPRDLALTFTKTATPNQYSISGSVGGNNLTLGAANLIFRQDGTLQTPTSINITAANLNAAMGATLFDATTPKNLTINLQDPLNPISGSLTQYSGNSTATISNQNGYQTGDLVGMEVDPQGKLLGSFTNGQTEILGQVIIAKFTNPEGMMKEGGNFFMPTANSGNANLGSAGETFPSTTIAGRSLEQSNVDLTEQFTDMISTQRAFEAASRTITVSDQLLQEITALKR
ncbi:MAG: flagellar hook protein FlgE [Candidatus Kapaibacteriota bacterium]|jgi:flagellar hook protein FlgE